MAHIEKRGTKYRARYRDPSGAERSKSFTRKIDASAFLASIEHSKLSGAYVNVAEGRVPFEEYAESWRAAQAHSVGTRRTVESRLRVHVYPIIGRRPIASIRRTEIQALVTRMSQILAPQTVITTRKDISAIFLAAVDDGLIAKSPCTKISSTPPPPQAVDEVLGREDVEAIWGAFPVRLQALVLVGAGTGMRPGELCGLTVDRVDFFRGFVRVDRQLVRRATGDRGGVGGDGRAVELGALKNRSSHRTIPIAASTVAAISAHLAQFPAHPEMGLVFTNPLGAPVQENYYTRTWKGAVKRLGEQGIQFPSWATPHDLRHYYASVLIRGGLGVKVVQTRLGHAKSTTTLDTYTHLFGDEEDRTREVMERELGPDKNTANSNPASGEAGSD